MSHLNNLTHVAKRHLFCNLICFWLSAGKDEWRLQPQDGTALNAHNRNLMRTLKPQIEQLHIDDQLDIDDGMVTLSLF